VVDSKYGSLRGSLGLAIRVHGSGSCQHGRLEYLNGYDTSPTRLLIGLGPVTRTRPDKTRLIIV
jgi:hypothetical protein